MAAASVVLVGVASVLVLLSTAQRDSRQHVQQTLSLERLAAQFRRDVRHAEEAIAPQPGEAELRLQLRGEQGEVEYRQQGSVLVRQEHRDGEVRRREAYRLAQGTTARVEVEGDEGRFVRLLIESPAEPAARDRRPAMAVEAALAADRR